MKRLLFPLFAVALLHQGHAAVYNSNFTGTVNPLTPGDGNGGWNQNDPDTNPDFPLLSPKTWIANVTSNNYKGLAIGGFYDVPSVPVLTSTTSTAAIALVDPNSVLARVTLNFAINDSSALYPDRNNFYFNVLDGANVSIASVLLTPVSQTHPGTPGTHNAWNVSLNGGAAFAAVFAGGDYALAIDFLNANQFTATVTNIYDNTFATSAATNKTLGSGSAIGGLQIAYEEGPAFNPLNPGANWGDNVFAIANVAVVPEPSSALLVGLAALGLLRRRRVQA